MNADCHSPVGAYATVEGNRLTLRAVGGSEDGTRIVRKRGTASPGEAEEFGFSMGRGILRELER
jgi:hydroxymethylbilane synthase